MGTLGVGKVNDGTCFSEGFLDAGEVEELAGDRGIGQRFSAFNAPVFCREHGEAFVEPMREMGVSAESPQSDVVEFVRECSFGLDSLGSGRGESNENDAVAQDGESGGPLRSASF